MLRFETAKAVTTLVVALAGRDILGAAGAALRLERIIRHRVERPLRGALAQLVEIEFRSVKAEDVAAVDQAVGHLISGSAIDVGLAAARPDEVIELLMSAGGRQVRADFRSDDLGNLFDQFLATAVREIGVAATLRTGYAVEAASLARAEIGDIAFRLDRLGRNVADIERAVSERRTDPGPRIAVDAATAGYRRALREYRPAEIDPRTVEIERVGKFVTGPGQWWAWRGEAWCGKSTLMALTLEALESQHNIVPFFINGRQVNSRQRSDFIARTLPRLAQVCGEELLAVPPSANQVDVFVGYLQRAAEESASVGKRLVLLVDGLDEDASADGESILGAIPSNLPVNACAVVSSRPLPLPIDVREDHPLGDESLWHDLGTSRLAAAARLVAEEDVEELLADDLGRDLAGLLAAAGAPLSVPDLAELTEAPPSAVKKIIRRRSGRCLKVTRIPSLDPRDGDDAAEKGYVLAHQEILRQVVVALEPQSGRQAGGSRWEYTAREVLAPARSQILRWADRWEQRGWPDTTPRYLAREYIGLLVASGDDQRLHALAVNAERRNLLRHVRGVPWLAEQEVNASIGRLAEAEPIDLKALCEACSIRDAWAPNTYFLDQRLPEVWMLLGRAEHAADLCEHLDEYPRHEANARLLRLALLTGDDDRAAQLTEALGPESGVVGAIRQLVAEGRPSGRAALRRVVPSGELDTEWDIALTPTGGTGASEPALVEDVEVNDPATEDTDSDSAEQERLARNLLIAAEAGDRERIAMIAPRLEWRFAGTNWPGRLIGDGAAMARRLVHWGVADALLPLLEAQVRGLQGPDGEADHSPEDSVARRFRAGNATWMLYHFGIALRRAGDATASDRIMTFLPDGFLMDQYLKAAAIDAAERSNFPAAAEYLSGINGSESLASSLASVATLAAWDGASCAADFAKSAEACCHDLGFASDAVALIHAFSSLTQVAGVTAMLEDLLEAEAILLHEVDDPDRAWRLHLNQADQISDAWTVIDGPKVLAAIADPAMTSAVYTRLVTKTLQEGRNDNIAEYLHQISGADDQWDAACAMASFLPANCGRIELAIQAGPPWIAAVVETAREQLIDAGGLSPEPTDDDLAWLSDELGADLAGALAEIADANSDVQAVGKIALPTLDRVLAVVEKTDWEHEFVGAVVDTIDSPTVLSVVHELISVHHPRLLDGWALAHSTRRALQLGDEHLAQRLVSSAPSLTKRADAAQVMVTHCLGRDDEEAAVVWANTMTDDYHRAQAYRDLAIRAVEAGRPHSAKAYLSEIAPEFGWLHREVRGVQLARALDQGSRAEAERVVASELANSRLDEGSLTMLASVCPDAVTSGARLALKESLARLASIPSHDLTRAFRSAMGDPTIVRR